MTAEMVRARREELERAVTLLRGQLSTWEQQDAQGARLVDKVRGALLAATNRRWKVRVEQVCLAIETEIVRLRGEEQAASVSARGWLPKLLG